MAATKELERKTEEGLGKAVSTAFELPDPKTLPDYSKDFPEPKLIEKDMKALRAVVVGPYATINMYLEKLIPGIFQKSVVELVEHAETPGAPYFDVEKQERGKKQPFAVIDFGKLTAEKASIPYLREARRAELLLQLQSFLDGVKEGRLPADMGGHSHLTLELLLSEWDPSETAERVAEHMGKGLSAYLNRPLSDAFERVELDGEKQEPRVSLVPFTGYRTWAGGQKVYCLVPKPPFQKELGARQKYDQEGNFLPSSVPVREYQERIEADLRKFAEDPLSVLQLFQLFPLNSNQGPFPMPPPGDPLAPFGIVPGRTMP